jgi:hypothetical protein
VLANSRRLPRVTRRSLRPVAGDREDEVRRSDDHRLEEGHACKDARHAWPGGYHGRQDECRIAQIAQMTSAACR